LHFFSDLYILNLAGGSTKHCIACRTRLRISKTRGIAMKRKGIVAFLIILALGTGLTLLNRCSGGDMATVRIVLNSDNSFVSKRNSLIDKFFNFFETKLYAVAVSDWVSGYDTLTLTVSGPDMQTITAVIPPTADSYTIEVPAGTGRIFTIIATESGDRKNGGRSIETLSPGESKTIQLRMLPIPTGLTGQGSSPPNINLIWSYIPGATGYYVYRAINNAEGPYTRSGGLVPQGSPGYGVTFNQSGEPGNTYFFRVAMVGEHGEGVETEEVSITIP